MVDPPLSMWGVLEYGTEKLETDARSFEGVASAPELRGPVRERTNVMSGCVSRRG